MEKEVKKLDYQKLFNIMHPDFFKQPRFQTISENIVYSELIMDLKSEMPQEILQPLPCPEEITFGEYKGELSKIQEAVAKVDDDWGQYFTGKNRIFCAFDNDKIAAFCIFDDWGINDSLHIGGPGCVGTVPDYRKKGIGLEMVRQATNILRQEGFDISWIHYTHLADWYSKLGYKTILKWNCKGFF